MNRREWLAGAVASGVVASVAAAKGADTSPPLVSALPGKADFPLERRADGTKEPDWEVSTRVFERGRAHQFQASYPAFALP